MAALNKASKGELDTSSLLYQAARMHAVHWHLAFTAAHEHGFTKLSNVLVGGGAFVPESWHDSFKTRVHDVALYLLGYHQNDFPFPDVTLVPPPLVPQSLRRSDWTDVLHVNAWCHSSFVGNGNRQDDTLDGAWGRLGCAAPLAWPLTNPWLRTRPVDVPSTPEDRPDDRLCGRPAETLLAARSKAHPKEIVRYDQSAAGAGPSRKRAAEGGLLG